MNQEAVERYSLRVWKYKQGEAVSLMIHLGDHLGLYKAMAASGRHGTPAELAETAGVSQRWVEEWLLGQVAAGLVDLEDGSFHPAGRGRGGARRRGSLTVFRGRDLHSDRPDRRRRADCVGRSCRERVLVRRISGRQSMLQSERMTGPQIEFLLVRFVLSQIDGWSSGSEPAAGSGCRLRRRSVDSCAGEDLSDQLLCRFRHFFAGD